jgi:hypothetical protein
MKPNIFSYATSELSQDAFFCWLLEWSKDEYAGEELNKISLDFINYILEKTNNEKIISINKIEIIRQEAKIDFYAKINNKLIILFEDKIGTQPHDNQLLRYRKYIENKYKNYHISYVYIKSGIIWKKESEKISEANYLAIDIVEILKILKNTTSNDIYYDYIQAIVLKQNTINSYNSLQFNEWRYNNDTWLGFYAYLESKIDSSGTGFWAGGLKAWLGLEYYWKEYEPEIDDEIDISLVMEKNMITIDAKTRDETNVKEHQEYLSEIIKKGNFNEIEGSFLNDLSKNDKNIRLITIPNIIITSHNGIIDIEKTIEKIMGIIVKFNNCFK